jgi:autotransporter-associated beta strand protein
MSTGVSKSVVAASSGSNGDRAPGPVGRRAARLAAAVSVATAAIGAGQVLFAPAGAHGATVDLFTGATSNDIGVAGNYNTSSVPNVSNGDIIYFNGSSALTALTYGGQLGGSAGNPGLSLNIGSGQTAGLGFDSGSVATAIRLGGVGSNVSGGSGTAITIAAGAGAVTFGDGSGTFAITLGGVNFSTQYLTNNSAYAATINSDVVLGFGGGTPHAVVFNGTGGWLTRNTVTSTFNLQVLQGKFEMAAGTYNVTTATPTAGAGYPTEIDQGGTIQVDAGAALNISGAATTSYFPIGNTANTSSGLVVNGGTVNVTNLYGTEVGRLGTGTLTVSSGLFSNLDTGSNGTTNYGLVVGDAQGDTGNSGTLNLNGGVLATNLITSKSGTDHAYFNGGTLRALSAATAANFWNGTTYMSAQVRNGGGTIDSNGFNISIGQALTHSTVAGDNAVDGGITKVGAGTLNLTGSSTYTGATVVSAGGLTLSGAGSINGTSGITLNGTKFVQLSSVASTAAVALNAGSLDGVGTVGAVTAASGTAVANGNGSTGTLTLASLLFSGTATDNVRLLGGTAYATPGQVVTGALTVPNTAGAITLNVSAGTLGNGTYDLLQYGSYTGSASAFTLGTVTGAPTSATEVLGMSGGYLTLTLSGVASDIFTGADSNVWQVGSTGSNHNFKSSATSAGIDYADGDAVIFNDTASAANTALNLGTNVSPSLVTFNNSSLSYTINSSGGFGINGSGSLVKMGAGTLTINTTNGYTGGTTITGGTVVVSSNANLGSTAVGAAPVTLDSGATLSTVNTAVLTDTHAITIGPGGATININSTGTAGTGQLYIATANLLQGSGPLTLTGNGTVTTTGAGNLRIGAANSYGGAVTINSGGSFEYGVAGAVAPAATFTVGNQGELITNNGVTFPNAITVLGGTNSILSFENGTAGVISGPVTLNASATIGLRDWYNNATVRSGTISGVMSGTGGITTSPGTATTGNPYLYLTGANTYTGPTVIAANTTLQLAATEGATGSLSPNSAITDNGTLQFQRTVASVQGTDFSGAPITGTGGVTVAAQTNAVTVTLNAANTYSGNTSIGLGNYAASTVIAAASGALGSGTVSILGNGTANELQLTGGVTESNPILLSAKTAATTGPGLESATGNNTLSGTVTFTSGGSFYNVQSDAGKLTFSNATAFTGGATTGTRTLNFTGAGSTVVSGSIVNGSAAVAVAQTGAGVTTLSGANSYTGATTVSAGTLLVNGTITSVPTVATGATLGGSGTVSNGTTVMAVSGTIAPGADAATVGKLTTGTESWSAGAALTVKTSGAAFDQLVVSGLTIGGAATVNVVAPNGSSGLAVTPGTYVLAVDTGSDTSVSNPFNSTTASSNLTLNVSSGVTVVGGGTFALYQSGAFDSATGGYDLDLIATSSAPEPASLLLAGLAVAPLVLGRRRRDRKTA